MEHHRCGEEHPCPHVRESDPILAQLLEQGAVLHRDLGEIATRMGTIEVRQDKTDGRLSAHMRSEEDKIDSHVADFQSFRAQMTTFVDKMDKFVARVMPDLEAKETAAAIRRYFSEKVPPAAKVIGLLFTIVVSFVGGVITLVTALSGKWPK